MDWPLGQDDSKNFEKVSVGLGVILRKFYLRKTFNEIMDPITRGMVESTIDQCASDKILASYFKQAKHYYKNGIIDSTKSFIFGLVLSEVQNTFFDCMRRYKSEPTVEETKEFMKLVDERSQKIKSRILEITSK